MNNDENLINNTSLFYLRKDATERLEWGKITEYLSNYCIFPHTKANLQQLQPWLDAKDRNFYFSCTHEVKALLSIGESLDLETFHFSLFEKELPRGSILSALALYQVLLVLKMSSHIHHFFKHDHNRIKRYPSLYNLSDAFVPQTNLLQSLQKSINAEGAILSSASPELHSARNRFENAKRKIVEHLEEYLKKTHVKNALQDSVWMLRDGRYVLPVRVDRKGEIDGIPRGVSQSGSTIFIEPHSLAEQHSQLEKALSEVEIEERRIIKELSNSSYLQQEAILYAIENLTIIDNVLARTKLAQLIEGVEPKFTTVSDTVPRFSFIKAKHPLFLLENKACIANDLELKAKYEGEKSPFVWVLSGPNAGGKTVALKIVGLSILMAKAGLFVSCVEAHMLDFENIFVELGDRQNREEDLSTFSGHLLQIKRITQYANELSLILLDEGFVGTDPVIGVAMARATLEFFAEKKSSVIITTHFSNLKTLADSDYRFFNASMEFEPKKLVPTYRLLNGIPGQSYAIELAQRMGLNEEILSKAYSYYGSEASRMENTLKELQLEHIKIKEEFERQEQLSLDLEKEVRALKLEKSNLVDLREHLVESYRSKLQKRLNAYQNRLEIRERQFERYKENLLQNIELSTIQNQQNTTSSIIESKEENKQKIEHETHKTDNQASLKVKKLSGFEELSQLKLPKSKYSLSNTDENDTLDKRAEKFRTPKYFNTRSLIDEARESLNLLNDSYNEIEKDLNEELDILTTSEKKSAQIAESAKSIEKTIQARGKEASYWKPGMKVKSTKFKETGEVQRASDAKGNIECIFGHLKVKVPYYELFTTEEARSQKTKTNIIQKPAFKKQASTMNSVYLDIPTTLQHDGNTIDLRGERVDVALTKLDQELDKMHIQNVERVIIIHGHGMGKIKEGVRKHLETVSYRLQFRGGRQGEGGDGVTIVEFL